MAKVSTVLGRRDYGVPMEGLCLSWLSVTKHIVALSMWHLLEGLKLLELLRIEAWAHDDKHILLTRNTPNNCVGREHTLLGHWLELLSWCHLGRHDLLEERIYGHWSHGQWLGHRLGHRLHHVILWVDVLRWRRISLSFSRQW